MVARMSPQELAGQVLMTAGTVTELPGLAPVVRRFSLAGVMVRGRSNAGTAAVAAAVRSVRAAGPKDVPLLVATDQEGGYVQVLSGPGFSTIPSGLAQARLAPSVLQSRAAGWGRELAAAGVDFDLAPVADTPCPETAAHNPAVADLDRNYGTDPTAAGRSVAAFVRGLGAAGEATTVKHFPGLGCVSQNTDTVEHVVDDAIGADSPRLGPFRDGIRAGAQAVMLSSATYAKIDPSSPALFSPKVIGGLLRGKLGFRGVVMSDDVGGAAALKPWRTGERATRFVAAGGDLMLDIVPDDMAPMSAALADRASRDPAFRSRLADAARHVVAARLRLGH
jgi:beta-N-acetylhexosaminidase